VPIGLFNGPTFVCLGTLLKILCNMQSTAYEVGQFWRAPKSSVSATVMVQEACVNELIQGVLKKNPQAARLITKATVRTNGPLTMDINVRT
jgi:hypothetical protein